MPDALWTVILNGKSAGDDALREAIAALRERGVDVQVRVTWETGDAGRYATDALADGTTTLIAAGGDGTLSEVATAMGQSARSADELPTLGLVPLGTANDFATAAGIPQLSLDALDTIAAGTVAYVDLLRIDADGRTEWCANLASGGFGTEVTVDTHEGLKKHLGGLAYLITGLARLGRAEPLHARFSGPGFAWEGDFMACAIGNGRQAGGGHVLCAAARIDDGLLDVSIVPPPSGEVLAVLGTLVSDGREAALDHAAEIAQLPWVEIESAQPMTLNLDGEPLESRHFRIECVPSRLRMHLPPASPLLAQPIPNGAAALDALAG